jgi:hypothetical protein
MSRGDLIATGGTNRGTILVFKDLPGQQAAASQTAREKTLITYRGWRIFL